MDLCQAVIDATRPEVISAVEAIYQSIGQAIAARKPVCVASGRCCKFEEFGHRLYVTTAELAYFTNALAKAPFQPNRRWDGAGCPFQVGKLCGVHTIKPLGCRMFYCDPTATDWLAGQYEHFHQSMRLLHEQFALDYRYLEWRAALAALNLAPVDSGGERL